MTYAYITQQELLEETDRGPDSESLGNWLRCAGEYFHRQANPQFTGHYDTTSGVNFNSLDRLLNTSRVIIKLSPVAISAVVAEAAISPTVTSEVSYSGGGKSYHATPGLGGGIIGFFSALFS